MKKVAAIDNAELMLDGKLQLPQRGQFRLKLALESPFGALGSRNDEQLPLALKKAKAWSVGAVARGVDGQNKG